MDQNNTIDVEAITRAFSNLTRTTGTLGNAMADKAAAEKRLQRDLTGKAQGAAGALSSLTTSAKDAGSFFKHFLGAGLLGGTLAKLISIGSDMTDTYRTLAASGHSFNGSMLNMSIAAASAGLPLSDFANAVTKNSLAIKAMGKKDFPSLQKGLITAMAASSNFGMTMEGITDFQAKSWETTRRTGLLKKMTDKQLIDQTVELASVTTTMSEATGVAREAILDLANSAIQESLAASRIAIMNSGDGIEANKKLQQSITILAAQSGAAGQFLSGLAANTFGMDGFAEFTEEGQTLISAGMGHLAGSFSTLSENMTPEATVQAMNDFRNEIGNNLPNLRDLAKGTGEGASSAKQLLKVYGEMQEVTLEQLRAKEEEKDGMTKFMLTFSTLWDQIAGGFRKGFLDGFKPLFSSVKDFQNSKTFMLLQTAFEKLGKGLGFLVNHILSEGVITKIGKAVEWLSGALLGGFEGLDGVGKAIKETDWSTLMLTLGTVIGGVALLFQILSPIMGVTVGLMKKFPDAAKAFIALLAGKMLLGKLTGMFRSSMTVNAGIVNVVGGMGGMGMCRPGRRRGALGGANGNRSRLAAMRRVASRGGVRGAARMGGRMALAGGKSLLTKIPGLGLLAGLGFGATALMSGQGVARAGLEVASGLVSMVPGIGTAASLAIDAGMMAKDASDAAKETTTEAKDSIESSQDAIAEDATGGEETDKKLEGDPMLAKFDIMIAQLNQANDLMVAAARSQTKMANDQIALLDRISKKNV